MAVSKGPRKKSVAPMTRSPFEDRTTIEASSAMSMAGRSEAGSACATAPPTVARLRTCMSAAWRMPSRTKSRRVVAASSAYVVRAPIEALPSAA